MSLSYKDAFTNMLIVFVNQRIKESKDMTDKISVLDEEKIKKFQKKVVEYITTKAKALAELQGLNYVGVTDNVVVEWIDSFFDEFEENMKEPEPKKVTTTTTKTNATVSKPKESKTSYIVEEGFFGLEVKLDKKKSITKEEFIEKINSENKDKIVSFVWGEEKVEVSIKEKEKSKIEIKNDKILLEDEENEEDEIDSENETDEEETYQDEDEHNDTIQMELNEEKEEEKEEEEGGFF
jgi:hypothetical protein